jgi:hypothetical protein
VIAYIQTHDLEELNLRKITEYEEKHPDATVVRPKTLRRKRRVFDAAFNETIPAAIETAARPPSIIVEKRSSNHALNENLPMNRLSTLVTEDIHASEGTVLPPIPPVSSRSGKQRSSMVPPGAEGIALSSGENWV